MSSSQRWPRPQFSLRWLFVATATCAAAFAVLARSPVPILGMFAACVPLFWLGLGLMVTGDGLRTFDHWLLNVPAELLATIGMLLTAGSVISAFLIVVLSCLFFLLGVA